MRTNISLLDRVDIAAPCRADWDKMEGDERARHCQECRLNVYNLSDMTRKEAEELVQRYEGQRLCVRFYRRKDGTIITDNCPVGVRRLRNFAAARWAALASAVSTLLWFPIARAMSFVRSDEASASIEESRIMGAPTLIPGSPISTSVPTAGTMSFRPFPPMKSQSGKATTGKISSLPDVSEKMGDIHVPSAPTLGRALLRREVKGELDEISSSKKR